MTHDEAFLRDIIEHPGDDTPRLIYADWLDEHGQSERAKFVRLQIERAELEKQHDRLAEQTLTHPGSCFCAFCGGKKDTLFKINALRRRERELLISRQGNDIAWRVWSGPAADVVPKGARYDGHLTFRRGFVAEVVCTLADWCGEECACTRTPTGLLAPTAACGVCRGTGRVGGHGPELVRAAPLERVTISAPVPSVILSARNLPLAFDEFLRQTFTTRDAYESCLSEACLAWATAAAELAEVRAELANLRGELQSEEECDEPTCDCKRMTTLRRREHELAAVVEGRQNTTASANASLTVYGEE